MGLECYASKKPSKYELSEVGSDEELHASLLLESVPMNLDGPIMDGEWQNFAERNRSEAEGGEASPRDSGTIANDIVVEEYSGAAEVKSQGRDPFAQLLANDEHRERRDIVGIWWPFSCREDWQVFKWLSSLRAPMEKIDEFFHLDYVRSLL